jgi:diguanylate cyclase (GGDEF)-like protein
MGMPLSILYVEDDPMVREALESFLRRYAGEALYLAADGVEGLERFRSHRPDLIITDIIMPRLDGMGMIRQIRAEDPEVPILMVTANSDSEFFAESIELRVDGYIPKPIDLDLLDHKINEVLRRLELRRAFEFQKRLLQEIAQLQGNMLVVLDREMRTIYVNRRMAEFLGVDPERPRDPRTHRIFWQSLWGDAAKEATPQALQEKLRELGEEPVIELPAPDGTPHAFSPDIVHVEETGHTLITFSEVNRLMQIRREYEYQATHDPLTGLGNRLLCDREVLDASFNAGKEGRPLSLAILDLDHFKRINDRYGHLTGDEILQAFARFLLERIEAPQRCYRWGGEEFVLLLPELDLSQAVAFCETLRTELASTRFTPERLGGTVSIGVAQMASNRETPTQLFERADRALYQSKRNGRNRTTAASSAPETGR